MQAAQLAGGGKFKCKKKCESCKKWVRITIGYRTYIKTEIIAILLLIIGSVSLYMSLRAEKEITVFLDNNNFTNNGN